MLTVLEKNTILSALRNGLGLTHACRGLHRHPKEVSAFIRENNQFNLECQQSAIAGYQSILIEMNGALNKKVMEKWRTSRAYIDNFITTVNLWESFCSADQFSFDKVTLAMVHCKIIPEVATAMGFSEIDFRTKIYHDSRLVQWLLQNNYQI